MEIPEHPTIRSLENTGDPKPIAGSCIVCDECGEKLIGEDDVFIIDDEYLCSDCARKCLAENLTPREITEKTGYAVMTASAVAEMEAE